MEETKLNAYFGTFGCGYGLADKVVCIAAPDMKAARAAMFWHFGKRFMTVYEGNELQRQIDEFNVKVMCSIVVRGPYDGHGEDGDEYDYKPIDYSHWQGIRDGDGVPEGMPTRERLIEFLVDTMGYQEADLADMPYEDLIDGLDINAVRDYIA